MLNQRSQLPTGVLLVIMRITACPCWLRRYRGRLTEVPVPRSPMSSRRGLPPDADAACSEAEVSRRSGWAASVPARPSARPAYARARGGRPVRRVRAALPVPNDIADGAADPAAGAVDADVAGSRAQHSEAVAEPERRSRCQPGQQAGVPEPPAG